jgi:hypothetical protein
VYIIYIRADRIISSCFHFHHMKFASTSIVTIIYVSEDKTDEALITLIVTRCRIVSDSARDDEKKKIPPWPKVNGSRYCVLCTRKEEVAIARKAATEHKTSNSTFQHKRPISQKQYTSHQRLLSSDRYLVKIN